MTNVPPGAAPAPQEPEDALESAAAHLLIELAFHVPKGTYLGPDGDIGGAIVEFRDAVRKDAQRHLTADLTAVRAQLAQEAEATQSYLQQAADASVLLKEERRLRREAEAALTALRVELKDLREDFSAMAISHETAREETLQAERELAEVRARLALPAFVTREGHDGTAPAPDESD